MLDEWLSRWREGRIGWHETDGNALMKRHWPRLVRDSSVLVPSCGKAVDMLWLASQGLKVTGVEISDIAARQFFVDNDLEYEVIEADAVECYQSTAAPVRIVRGDYFDLDGDGIDGCPFDALYDRGALVAVPPADRPRYVEQTRRLLAPDAFRLVISMTYDDTRVSGPPYSIEPDELLGYWDDLDCVNSRNALDESPEKFRRAGLNEVVESVWTPV